MLYAESARKKMRKKCLQATGKIGTRLRPEITQARNYQHGSHPNESQFKNEKWMRSKKQEREEREVRDNWQQNLLAGGGKREKNQKGPTWQKPRGHKDEGGSALWNDQ